LVKRGLPAVVVNTEQFTKLAKAVMRSQKVPESIAVEIKGNPEFVSAEDLQRIADDVIEKVVDRLTKKHFVVREGSTGGAGN